MAKLPDQPPKETVLDMQSGVYRRIYAEKIRLGKRINKVSINAEFWFWRLHLLADDFGNFPADPGTARQLACPLRPRLRDDQVLEWQNELAHVGLISIYSVRGESYGHIAHWEENQPANRSGRRIRRYPQNLQQSGESGGIRGNPGESQPLNIDSDIDIDSKSNKTPPKPPWGARKDGADQFDDYVLKIYGEYPKKIARGAALPKIVSAVYRLRKHPPPGCTDEVAWLLERVKLYAVIAKAKAEKDKSWDWIPAPATWFHQERYFDSSIDEPPEKPNSLPAAEQAAIDAVFGEGKK